MQTYSKTILNQLYKKGIEIENQIYNAIKNSKNEDIPFLYGLVNNSSFESGRTQEAFYERLSDYWKELSVGLMNEYLFNVVVEGKRLVIHKKHSHVVFTLTLNETSEVIDLDYMSSKYNDYLISYFTDLTSVVENMNNINYDYLRLLSAESFFNKKKKSRLITEYNEAYSKYINILRGVHEMERDLQFNASAIVEYLGILGLNFANKINDNHLFSARRNNYGLFTGEAPANSEREEMVYYIEGIRLLKEAFDNINTETHGVTYAGQNRITGQESHYYLGRSEIQANKFEVTKLISLLVPFRIETTFENKLIKMIENDNTFGQDMPLLIK